ncbi:MAG: response regulator, partial [Burkholderiales bacterium]|nr:response regulator [Burkholderiales bacterium]
GAAPAHAAPHLRPPQETLVMVADDSKVVRVKTSRLLAQHQYRVVLAEDGAQAARLIDEEVPLVLITDVEMPGMDGFELTRHVRAHPRAGGIAVIMITSADERIRDAAHAAGVTQVLGKPYPEEALIACIEHARSLAAERLPA